uniref:Fe2OG dioxygenase domain-containing protein n=1 Tax=viral metagenome TaxID=1070528 RepID=A0A6C0JHV7_9ZZZZ
MINGLTIVKDFITKDQELELLEKMKDLEWNGTLLRKSRHYGYNYNYKTKNITYEDYLGNLPSWLDPYILKIFKFGYIYEYPDQVTINRYLPGEGIAAHIDVPRIFKEKLYSISLGSGCNIVFEKDDEYHSYYIPPRTFMLMEDSARYLYKHGIRRFKSDMVLDKEVERDIRYSITFRNVIL